MKLSHALKIGALAVTLSGCGGHANVPSLMMANRQIDEECYQGSEFECAAEKEILRLNNDYRARSGLAALSFSGHMSWTARDWSKKQAARGSIGHDGFPGWRSSVYVTEFGSMEGVWVGGENVAYFSDGAGLSAEEAGRRLAQMWWNSSGHRANMLGRFAGVGVGVVRTPRGSVFGTQIFYQLAQ